MKKRKTLSLWFRRSGAFKWAMRPRFTEPLFEPYAKAIGQLLLAWNDLHERLSTLFVMAMGGGWVNRPLAIWHGSIRDYSKRQMLRAAISDMPDGEKAGRMKLVEEITWILDAADKLEGLRDDSAHTPLVYYFRGVVADLRSAAILPNTSFQNPRAMRIDKKNKDILIESRYARERIIILRDYAIAIDAAWSNARLPWPDRPDLPERKPNQARQSQVGARVPK
jgi:hypothetical protein